MPVWLQNLAISFYNTWLYKKRHGGTYRFYRDYYQKFELASEEEVAGERERRLNDFLSGAVLGSSYYGGFGMGELYRFPVLEKRTLLTRLNEIATVPESNAEVSLTGGTTGASMKVLYTREDIQERNAMLDHFRAKFGYKLGKRTRSEEHTSELQSRPHLVCRLLLEKKKQPLTSKK